MEESAKRRERLRAMRVEADQAEVSYNVEGSGLPVGLSNPLLETERTVVQESCAPRFDFYTDPMAAFSDSKKSGKAGNQIRPDCFTSPSNSCFPMSRFSPSLPGTLLSLLYFVLSCGYMMTQVTLCILIHILIAIKPFQCIMW